jgi:hypothetical protein
MIKAKELPSSEYLNEYFLYNHETGDLMYKSIQGKISGSILNSGHKQVMIEGKAYLQHRIIWKMIKEKDPNGYIDHINGNGSDNRIENLREATCGNNKMNSTIYKNNKSGLKGAYWDKYKNKWFSQIRVNGNKIFLGRFNSIEEAHKAYCKAAMNYHGEFANFGY